MQSPSDSAGSADSVCAICLEGFVDFEPSGRETMHLECLHRFHADCIRKWIDTKPSCPVCKCSTQHDGTGRSITTEFLLGSRSQFPQFPRGVTYYAQQSQRRQEMMSIAKCILGCD